MDIWVSCLLCLLFMWVFIRVCSSITSRSRSKASSTRLPPGPRRIPILGNLLDLGDKPHRSMAELAQIHGPIMSLKLGSLVTVVVSSATMAREVLQKNDLVFSNRTIVDSSRASQCHELSTGWLPVSPLWRNFRKVFNLHIFSSHKLEASQHLCSLKIGQLFSTVQESSRLGEVMDIGQAAFNTTLNVLSNLVFSVDLADSNSQRAREFNKTVQNIMVQLGRPNLADYFPLVARFDPQGIRRKASAHIGKLFQIFEEMYDERLHLRKGKGSMTNDVLDTLIDIVEDENQELERKHVMHLLLDIFVAGTDTTSSALEWAMAELLHNPKTLLKAKVELEEAIGKGKLVKESDMTNLPYLRAIVKETFRLHSAFLLPRRAGADVEICGYTVPEGAQVLVNVWAIGRDPSIWETPSTFMPERFLGSETDVKGRHFELIPFGGGRRICPGINPALRMLHSMLGSLINCFEWKLEDGVTPENMNMEEKFGLTLHRAQPLRAIPVSV